MDKITIALQYYFNSCIYFEYCFKQNMKFWWENAFPLSESHDSTLKLNYEERVHQVFLTFYKYIDLHIN